MEASTSAKRAVDAATVAEAFSLTAAQNGDRVAFKTRDGSLELTWGEVRERADAIAGGLVKLGVKPGDCVALMFGNRPEFNLCDLAVMTVRGTPFSIYQTYAPEQIQYVCSDSAARVGIVEAAVPRELPRGAQEPARHGARGRRRRRCTRGHDLARGARGHGSRTSTARPHAPTWSRTTSSP